MTSTTLFTLSQSWHEAPWLHERLAFAGAGDSILLQGDAVLALHSPISLASFVAKCAAAEISVYALHPDCAARGVRSLYETVTQLGYDGYVELVTDHDKQVAW